MPATRAAGVRLQRPAPLLLRQQSRLGLARQAGRNGLEDRRQRRILVRRGAGARSRIGRVELARVGCALVAGRDAPHRRARTGGRGDV